MKSSVTKPAAAVEQCQVKSRKYSFQKAITKIGVFLTGQSGKHQFWSEPSEILDLRSSPTPETVAFTQP